MDKLREEKEKYKAFLNNNFECEELLNEGIDLASIYESINELESKLEEYNKMISIVIEIEPKIKKINDIINSNNNKIKILEKELSHNQKEISKKILVK